MRERERNERERERESTCTIPTIPTIPGYECKLIKIPGYTLSFTSPLPTTMHHFTIATGAGEWAAGRRVGDRYFLSLSKQ